MTEQKAVRKTYPKGRMLRDTYSRDKQFASMSISSQCLFFYLIPHFDSHGKFQGDPNVIKGLVIPFVEDFNIETIVKCLSEISEKTNLKWFEHEGLMYLQFLDWREHQDLREDRLGADRLPTYPGITEYKENELKDKKYKLLPEYSRSSPGVLPREVEVEVEGEAEDKEEEQGEVKREIENIKSGDLSFSSLSEDEAKGKNKCSECGKAVVLAEGKCMFCAANMQDVANKHNPGS